MKTGDLVKYTRPTPCVPPAKEHPFAAQLGVVLSVGPLFCKVIWFFDNDESSSTWMGKDSLELVSESIKS